MRCAGYVARIRERRSSYEILVGKPEGKGALRITGFKWEDNINMDLKQVGWVGVDWIQVDQDSVQLWVL
jgi:hypothetical protein